MTAAETAGPRIVAIVQARMGSTRLPGKSLADLAGKPLLQRVIERCQASAMIDDVWLATTTEAIDNALADLCGRIGVKVYRGSVDDVLDRFYQTARKATADVVVRVTADDPFKDPEVIDLAVRRLLRGGLDYVSNTIEPTYPEGLDIETVTFEALERAWKEARLASEREHVTPYIWKNPQWFQIENFLLDTNLSHLRWTVDYEQDLKFARAVYERLGHEGIFSMHDVLALIEKEPELATINQGIVRNQGYLKSLAHDRTAQ